jgi:putative redox protein
VETGIATGRTPASGPGTERDALVTDDGVRLACHLARPSGSGRFPGLVLCHGFPTAPRGAAASGLTFPEFADRIARDAGWVALTFNFRGTGRSDGDFSVSGWVRDQRRAVEVLSARPEVAGVWLVGTGVGGTLALVTGAEDPRVRGVATLGSQASLTDWARDPARFLRHCRELGVFRDPDAPADPAAWMREIVDLDALDAARRLAPRPLLVLHGSDDDVVPLADAERIAAAHGRAELRVVQTGGHRLRHDPRAVASLLGWLDRQSV